MTDEEFEAEIAARKALRDQKKDRDARRRATVHHLVDNPDDVVPEEFAADPMVTRIVRALREPERIERPAPTTERPRDDRTPRDTPRSTPTPPPAVWDEARLTTEATRLFKDGKNDAEVAAALTPHNPDGMLRMKAQAAGKKAK